MQELDGFISPATSARTLAAQLDAAREQRGLTRTELAEATGITRVTLRHALDGHDIRVSTLLALADRLGLDLALVPRGLAQALAPNDIRDAPGPAPAARAGLAQPGPQMDPRTLLGAALQRVKAAPA